MDRENPAVTQFTSIPPAVLEKIVNDPAAFGPWARALLVMQIDEFDTLLKNEPEKVTTVQKMEFMNFLAKLGDAMPKANTGQLGGPGGGFGVTIVLNAPAGAAGRAKPLQVIENE